MEEKVNEILEILKESDESTKEKIILECATKIGSTKWIEEVKELMKRMEKL